MRGKEWRQILTVNIKHMLGLEKQQHAEKTGAIFQSAAQLILVREGNSNTLRCFTRSNEAIPSRLDSRGAKHTCFCPCFTHNHPQKYFWRLRGLFQEFSGQPVWQHTPWLCIFLDCEGQTPQWGMTATRGA